MNRQQRLYTSIIAALLFAIITCNAQQQYDTGDRQAVFAGSFYPGSRPALEAQLQMLFRTAEAVKSDGRIQTLIVPHAGYDYSGLVAASGYKSIPSDTPYENIFIIASSHRESFNGFSIYPAGNYVTPLGKAQVNSEIAGSLIKDHKKVVYYGKAHDREHSIEVQIPFIQYHFKETPPI